MRRGWAQPHGSPWVPLQRMAPGLLRPAVSRLRPGGSVHSKAAHPEPPSVTAWQGKPSRGLARPGSKTPPPPPQMALYFCSGVLQDQTQFRHYALNVPLYTHFTSPIRRFADVLVHRLLAAALGKKDSPGARAGLRPPKGCPGPEWVPSSQRPLHGCRGPEGWPAEQQGSLGPETLPTPPPPRREHARGRLQ